MTIEFKHFDARLGQWIHTDGNTKNPDSILTEKLDNTLLEFYFPGKEFSFGHTDDQSKPDELRNHPNGQILLLSSKSRLLYGSPECLELIDKLCPNRTDRGGYGSIFLGACKNSLHEELNILVVDDTKDPGENGGIIDKKNAFKLVGDSYGQISPELYDKLTKRAEQPDNSYHVIQHRFGWTETDGQDTKYRFGKGTLRPYKLDRLKYAESDNKPKIDIILPLSSFKGTDKDRPGGPIKPQIQPGLYRQKIWLGEKSQSQKGKTAISQLLASFPQGLKDFAEELEAQAKKLAEIQSDPRKVAQLYCEKYEKRKVFIEEQKASLQQNISNDLLVNSNEDEEELDLDDEDELAPKDDLLMYRIIKADLASGHNQLLETEKVTKELRRFLQGQWRDIAIGRAITFDRGMIIPSKELKNGEICVPWFKEGEKVLNFRSPFLNSNGLCVSTNKRVDDCLAPDGTTIKGLIVVNDEDHKRIKARIAQLEAQGIDISELVPAETESQRQGRDYDGDCIGVEQGSKYPNLTAEAELRNLPTNAYAPTRKLDKLPFYNPEDGSQPPFEVIAIHMSDRMSVGIINNQDTALVALESEIEILKTYGTSEQQSNYVDIVAKRYQKLLEAENQENPHLIRDEYKPSMQEFVTLAQAPRSPEIVAQAMEVNRRMYRKMIEEASFQNQIAVDLFKSAKKPEMGLIKENNRYLYRKVDYIRGKKSQSAYLTEGIKTTGFSPVELLINQANKYWERSQLESRPIVQFQDLFRGVEFTPQQRLEAIAAKFEFDRLYNAAVRMDIKRETEQGPSAIIQTEQGKQIEITNLTRYRHPLVWKAQTLNLKLELIESAPTKERPHRLVATAQINNEVSKTGKPVYRELGTVSLQSVVENNLKPGMATDNAKVLEFRPELSRSQTKLMFDKANQYAQLYRDSIPPESRLSAAAAAWVVGAARQDELERKELVDEDSPQKEIIKKIPNFVFAAFGDEIVSQLNQLQFTELTLGTLSEEANNYKGKQWNPDEKYPIEIRASDHPPGHKRHGLRLAFVQDTDGQYKEYAAFEPRTGQLPIGTKAMANIIPGQTYTANATIKVPGKPDVNFTIREMSKFTYAGRVFNAEDALIEIGTKSVPSQTVKIQLDGQTLGELDADSIKQLQAYNIVRDGQPLNLKLKTISDNEKHGFVLAQSPNGNLLRINNIGKYAYKGQTFNDEKYRKMALSVSEIKVKEAVFLNGEPLGLLFYNKDKDALREIGVLQPEKLISVQATIQSNFSTAILKVDPATVQYPQTWTKESQAFGKAPLGQGVGDRVWGVGEREHPTTSGSQAPSSLPPTPYPLHPVFGTQQPSVQQQMVEITAPILAKIKERPTMLLSTPENKEQGITYMAVDNHKVATVTGWLQQNKVIFAQLPKYEVALETKKGLAVFSLLNSSIRESIGAAMTKKFGAVISSTDEYLSKVLLLPNRPWSLHPPQDREIVERESATNVALALRPVKEFTPNDFPAVRMIESAIASKPLEEKWWFDSTGMPIGSIQGDASAVRGGFQDEELKALPEEHKKFYKQFWGSPVLATHNHPTNNPVNGFTSIPVGQRYSPLSGGDLKLASWYGHTMRAVNAEYAGGVVHEFKPGLAYQTDIEEALLADPNITLNPSKLESFLQSKQYYTRDDNDELVPVTMTDDNKPTLTTYELPKANLIPRPRLMGDSFTFNSPQKTAAIETTSPNPPISAPGRARGEIPIRNSQFAIRSSDNCELRTDNCELSSASPASPTPQVTIEDFRSWYDNADTLGRSDDYKKRIVEVGNAFKAGQPPSDKAIAAMQQDKTQLDQIIRITEIAQRLGNKWGVPIENNLTLVTGNSYDLAYNRDRQDLAIAQKNGEVLLQVEQGKITINKVTPHLLETFDNADKRLEAINRQKQQMEVQQ